MKLQPEAGRLEMGKELAWLCLGFGFFNEGEGVNVILECIY